jgi:hypothetical protein
MPGALLGTRKPVMKVVVDDGIRECSWSTSIAVLPRRGGPHRKRIFPGVADMRGEKARLRATLAEIFFLPVCPSVSHGINRWPQAVAPAGFHPPATG